MSLRADRHIVVLICATAWAQQAMVPQLGNIGSTLQYHHREWEVIQRTQVTLDAAAGPLELALLEASQYTHTGGAGQALSDVDLLIVQSGRIIYDYLSDPKSTGPPFYMDDYLETRNLTKSKDPAVLFHSGTRGASDFTMQEHILRYDKSKGAFVDVALEEFYNSGTHGLGWFTMATGTFVVIADRNWSPATRLDDECHYCPSPFKYSAYQWSNKRGAFTLQRKFSGKESYSEADEALKGDQALIESALKL